VSSAGARIRLFRCNALLDFDKMVADLKQAGPNDVISFCMAVATTRLEPDDRAMKVPLAQGFLPFIDIAYQFGDGWKSTPVCAKWLTGAEMLIAASCSKKFRTVS
jgi:aspartate/tyrosine/aromatic aminotransferase